jgi:eukaryotic-like serine/threonine-protein kinase
MTENDPPRKDFYPAVPASEDSSSNGLTPPLGGTAANRSIGNYQLLKKLGEGGMGQVWLAEQTAPVRRQVALKFIRAGMCDDTMLHRFQSERQSLAIMDHPSIAKVFDAGATPDGQPYFVMEYVPGLPITDYCDQKKLNIRERLELFMQVCEGVQHAHQKAIVHRDLKPANVLVVEVDGKPMARIIDFGLAKTLIPRGFGETMVTLAGAPLGTPAYMSPEQADPEIRDIDTRTDVYSLGVLLYELLTGTLPFDPEEWQNKPLAYVLRQVRESDTPRPSTQFKKRTSMHREAATAAAAMRGSDSKQLSKLLRGDLDWIVMKAVEKDRARRYGTPSELAADISRYLCDELVLAGPATTGYRVRKYAVRHRIALGAVAALLLVLTGFVVLQAVELRRITQERDRTTRERDRASRITNFMTGIFKVSKPSEARGNTITAREILDKASADIDIGLTKDPELQAQMMTVMGDVYDNLGLYSRAQVLQQKTLEIRQRALGRESPETLQSVSALAQTLFEQGHYTEAETLQRHTLAIQKRVLGPQHPDTLGSMNNLARLLYVEGHYAEADKLGRETLDIRRRVLGPEHPDTLRSMSDLALVLNREARLAEAEKLNRETLDIRRRVLGPDHPDTLTSIDSLALDVRAEHRNAEAEELYLQALDIRRRILGPEHPDTLTSMNNLANVLSGEGRFAEAEKLKRVTLDIRRRVLGPEHPDTLKSMINLSETLTKVHEYTEAERLLRQAIDIQRRVLEPDSPDLALSTYNLGCLAANRGRRDEALSLIRQAVDHGAPPYIDTFINKDNDLKSLHGDPRFDALVVHAEEKAAAASQKPR